MEAVQSFGTPAEWSCVTLKRFSAKAMEQLSSRQSVWLRVLRGTFGTDMAGVVVTVTKLRPDERF